MRTVFSGQISGDEINFTADVKTSDLGEYIKESWGESKADVPVSHAELLNIKEFSETINVPPEQILEILKTKGYKVKDFQQTLGDIAKENNTSPDKLYEEIKTGGARPDIPATIKGSGLGKKSLEKICAERGLSLDQVLERVRQKGVEASPDDRLSDVAKKLGITPMEVFHIIEGKQN